MKHFAIIGLLASLSFGAINPVQVPYLIDSAVVPQVTYIDQNDAALQNKINQVVDSVNLYIGGALKASRLQSTGSVNVTLDSDNNQTNQKFSVTNNGQADTLFKVDETQRRTRAYGNLTVDSSLDVSGQIVVGGSISVSGGAKFAATRYESAPPDTVSLDSTKRFVGVISDTAFFTLPSAASNLGRDFVIRVADSSARAVINTTDIIYLDVTAITQFELPRTTFGNIVWYGVTLTSDGTSWWATSSIAVEQHP